MGSKKLGRPRATTHEGVLRVARGLFAERGYAATSLEVIAAAAGIGRTSLFAYFPAKSDLVWAPYDAISRRLDDLLAARPADEPVAVSITAALGEAICSAENDHSVLAEIWELVEANPELQTGAAERSEAGAASLGAFVADRLGLARDELLPQVLASALTAAAITATRHWSRHARESPLAEAVHAAVEPVLTGFSAQLRPREVPRR